MAIRRKHPETPEAASTSSGDAGPEGPLARWSRRKTMARSQRLSETVPPPAPAEALTPPAPSASAGKSEVTVPPVDKLDEHSDYSAFLSPEVDEKVRRVALRKLFHLSRFNIIDGLDDYAEDYTSFTPLGDVITADMRFHAERRAQELEQQLLAEGEDREAKPKEATGESADAAAAGTNEADGVSVSTDQASAAGSEEPDAPATGQVS